jgi:hypothetical protein
VTVKLSEAETAQLSAILHTSADKLDKEIDKYAAAATEEYVRLFLGQRVFTRGTDFREFRLLLLIKHVFNALPSEAQISALFQTTTTQSRALLRAVMSKYQYELQAIIRSSLSNVLQQAIADPNGDGKLLVLDSENIVQRLNTEIAAIDGTLRPVLKVHDTAGTYTIDLQSFTKLTERFKK